MQLSILTLLIIIMVCGSPNVIGEQESRSDTTFNIETEIYKNYHTKLLDIDENVSIPIPRLDNAEYFFSTEENAVMIYALSGKIKRVNVLEVTAKKTKIFLTQFLNSLKDSKLECLEFEHLLEISSGDIDLKKKLALSNIKYRESNILVISGSSISLKNLTIKSYFYLINERVFIVDVYL